MPNDSTGRTSSDPMKNNQSSSYDDWFKESPDPWEKISDLEFGGDRSFATDVELIVLNAAPKQWPDLEKKLMKALGAAEGRPAPTLFICQMLALVGSEGCVDAVGKLLLHPPASHAARIALQPNPAPSVNPLLQSALGSLKDAELCGLIGTIAARRDTSARSALESIAGNTSQPQLVRDTAARAAKQLQS